MTLPAAPFRRPLAGLPIGRRTLLALALTAAAGVQAQEAWPNKPVRIVIPVPAGGGLDGSVRAIAERLGEALKQPVIVESRPGGNGAIAYSAVAKAAPDGYTVLVSLSSLVQTVLLSKSPTYSLAELQPVSLVAMLPNGFAVNKDVPVNSVAQFVEWAKKQPAGVDYGSSGAGSSGNIMGGTLAQVAGLNLVHVPYKGEAPAIQGLMGGEIKAVMAAPGSLAVQAKAGNLKLLAVALPNRLKDYPDVPTFGELGYPGVNLSGWAMAAVPAGTPKPIVDRLSAEIARIVKLPEVAGRILAYGFVPEGSTVEGARKFIEDETVRWGAAIKAAKIVIE